VLKFKNKFGSLRVKGVLRLEKFLETTNCSRDLQIQFPDG
jgi:hypothetical protein